MGSRLSRSMLVGSEAIDRDLTLEFTSGVAFHKGVHESLRPFDLIRLNNENETVSITAVVSMLEDPFSILPINVVVGFVQNGRRRWNHCREFFAIGDEWDPRDVVL